MSTGVVVARGTSLALTGGVVEPDTDIRSIDVSVEGVRVPITDLLDTDAVYEMAEKDTEVTLVCFGTTATVPGDHAQLVVTWNTGDTFTLANAMCISSGASGEVGGEITNTTVWIRSESST